MVSQRVDMFEKLELYQLHYPLSWRELKIVKYPRIDVPIVNFFHNEQ